MSDDDKAILIELRKQALALLAVLPERKAEEAKAAAEEGRQPVPIIPLITVHPAFFGKALAAIREVPPDLAETVGTLRRVCRQHPEWPFDMYAHQFVPVMDLAGIK